MINVWEEGAARDSYENEEEESDEDEGCFDREDEEEDIDNHIDDSESPKPKRDGSPSFEDYQMDERDDDVELE
jgi:hypothetical protein